MDGVEVNGYTIEPGADLRGADLRGANLSGANLHGANLTSVRLPFDGSGASDQYFLTHDCDDEFIITNLSGANLVGADLGGAIADAETEWPGGFDPKAAGVIFED